MKKIVNILAEIKPKTLGSPKVSLPLKDPGLPLFVSYKIYSHTAEQRKIPNCTKSKIEPQLIQQFYKRPVTNFFVKKILTYFQRVSSSQSYWLNSY